MRGYPRQELEQMVQLWVETNARAEREGNWRPLADLYTEDAYYCWDIPGGLYEARGRENIRATCVGDAMDPYAGWTYPYDKVVIDEHKGECFASWWQTPPGAPVRTNGAKMRIIGASWFRYGGNRQWCEQRDFYDFGKTMEFIDECADRGILSELAMQRRKERNQRLIHMLEQRLAYLRKSVEA